MADAYHYFGSDLTVSTTGGLSLATGSDVTLQRVLRRLLTNPGAYIQNLNYGAGLGRFVGQPARPARIRGVILRQMKLEGAVARSPAPTAVVSVGVDGTVIANISYSDAVTKRNVSGVVTVPRTGSVSAQLASSIASGV